MTALAAPAISPATSPSWAGLWARITTSARSASSRLEASASPPSSCASAAARPEPESVQRTGSPQPRASAAAMFPAPMKPSCMARKDTDPRSTHLEGAGRAGAVVAAVGQRHRAALELGRVVRRRAGAAGARLADEGQLARDRARAGALGRVGRLERVTARLGPLRELEAVRLGAGADGGAAAGDHAAAAHERELHAAG